MAQHDIRYLEESGYVVGGMDLNACYGNVIYQLSNRRMKNFNDLKELYFNAMIIHENIDLTIAGNRFPIADIEDAEKLLNLKEKITVLTDYYRQFKRDKK